MYLLAPARSPAARVTQYSGAGACRSTARVAPRFSKPSSICKNTQYFFETRCTGLSSSKCHPEPDWGTTPEAPKAQHATEANGRPFDDTHKCKRFEGLCSLTYA